MDAADAAGRLLPASIDPVAGCMSFQGFADPAAALAGAGRLLRAGGRAAFSVPHPATDPPVRVWERDAHGSKLRFGLDRYFDGGPAVCALDMSRLKYPWRTPCRRHTLSEWAGMVRAAGLVIAGLHEPRPDAVLVAARPELEDCARMTYFLVVEAERR